MIKQVTEYMGEELNTLQATTVTFWARIRRFAIAVGLGLIFTVVICLLLQVGQKPNPAHAQGNVETPVDVWIKHEFNYELFVKPGDVAVFILGLHISDTNNSDLTTIELTVSATVPVNTRFNAYRSNNFDTQWDCADGSPAGTICRAKHKYPSFGTMPFAVIVDPLLRLPTTRITNTAEIEVNRPDPNPSNNHSTGTFSIDFQIINTYKSATISKDQNNNKYIDPGDEITYLIAFTNTGQVAVNNFELFDNMGDRAFEVISGSLTTSIGTVSPKTNASRAVVNIVKISPNQKGQASFKIRINGNFQSDQTVVINKAYFGLADSFNVFWETNVVTTPLTPKVDLVVQADPSQPNIASIPRIFDVYYRNIGHATATNVVIREVLMHGVAMVPEASTPGWECVANQCTFKVAQVGAFGDIDWTGQLSFTVTPTLDLPVTTILFTHTVQISDDGAHGVDVNLANNTHQQIIPFGISVPLELTKAARFVVDTNGDGKWGINDEVQFTLVLRNSRKRASLPVLVSAALFGGYHIPESITTTQGNIQYDFRGEGVYIYPGQIYPGQSVTMSYRVRLTQEAPIILDNFIDNIAVGDMFGINTSGNTLQIPWYHPYNIQLSLTTNSARNQIFVIVREPITLTYVITNTGALPITRGLRLIMDYDFGRLRGAFIVSGTAISTRGSILYESDIGRITFNFGDMPELLPGKILTAGLTIAAFDRSPEVFISAFAQWQASFDTGVDWDGGTKFSNIITYTVLPQNDLLIQRGPNPHLIPSIAARGNVVQLPLSYDSRAYAIGPLGYPINSAQISITVPKYAKFDANASSPFSWACNNGGIAESICFFNTPPITRPFSGNVITFAFKLRDDIPANVLFVNQTVGIADDGSHGADSNPSDNFLILNTWLLNPISATHYATFDDTNANGGIDVGEKAHFQTLVMNTSGYTLPYLIFDDFILGYYAPIYASGILTTPDGTFPVGNEPTAPPGALRARINVPIPPGFVIASSIDAILNSAPLINISGTYTTSKSAYGPFGYVYDQYFGLLQYIPPADIPYGPSLTPPPTNTSRITLIVDALPDSKQNFRFSSSLGSFKLDDATPDDGDSVVRSRQWDVPASTYTFTADIPYSWFFQNISCTGDNPFAVNQQTGVLTISAQVGKASICTVSIGRASHLLGRTWNDRNADGMIARNEPMQPGWRLALSSQVDPKSVPTRVLLSNAFGQANFNNQAASRYKLCEQPQTAWRGTKPTAKDADGQPCYWITIPPGKSITLWFGNTQVPPALTTPVLGDDDIIPELVDRPEVPFDEAGYDGHIYEDADLQIRVVYLPILLTNAKALP